MKGLFLSILASGMLPALALPQQAATSVGQIVSVQGTASAVGADGKSRPLTLKSPLFLKDTLTTEAGSRLQILFSDDSTLSQGEMSTLVIDDYVFTPEKKADNVASLNLTRGSFRLVTDNIARLNPERFKVKTPMATIGLRGCDLGFELGAGEERIYVIMLRGNERISVERIQTEQETQRRGILGLFKYLRLMKPQDNTIEVQDSGTMVALRHGWPMDLLRIPWGQLRWMEMPVAVRPVQPEPPPPTTPDIPLLPPPAPSQSGLLLAAEHPPAAPTRDLTTRGGGTDWKWGVWEFNGVADSTEFTSPKLLTAIDFQSISSGSHLYNLSGNGSAAAVIRHGTGASLIEGTCALNIQMGRSVTPNWDGTFSMRNTAGDALDFEAGGTLRTDGAFTGNETFYLMRVNGTDFDRTSITAETINGRMVGGGSAAAPSGAIGSYSFSHGSAARVDGGFGADVRERVTP